MMGLPACKHCWLVSPLPVLTICMLAYCTVSTARDIHIAVSGLLMLLPLPFYQSIEKFFSGRSFPTHLRA